MFRLCRAIIRPFCKNRSRSSSGFVLTKRPDYGSVETKHVALNVFLTINWMYLTEKICTLYTTYDVNILGGSVHTVKKNT